MKTATLKCETLHLLPGVAEDFDEQVKQLVDDCRKRPAVTKDRVLKVEQPARTHDRVRARRSARNQLQFDFGDEV